MSDFWQFLLYGVIEFGGGLMIVVLSTRRGTQARRHDLLGLLTIATAIAWWSVYASPQRGSEYASALNANYVFAWSNLVLLVVFAALCGGRRVILARR